MAVRTTSTRESGSSTQSTGTSWMRNPLRSASTSSSVSKNQPWSSTRSSSRRATSRAHRLEPALRIGEAAAQRHLEQQVVAARDRLAARARARPWSRRPAGCRWRRRCGPTRAGRRGGAGRRDRSTGRRPCTRRPVTGSPTRRCAAPDPGPSGRGAGPARRRARRRGARPASQVPSVLALSAIVICQVSGNRSVRYVWRRRTDGSSAATSSCTGTTISTSRWAGRIGRLGARRAASVMGRASGAGMGPSIGGGLEFPRSADLRSCASPIGL